MFVQVIEGRLGDRAAFRQHIERWMKDLRPGAVGFLGATIGVTDDGQLVNVARFESAAAARANSERPEQGEWWAQAERSFEGAATFTESEDVEELLAGGSDEAGFVQVMKSRNVDRGTVRSMDERFLPHAASFRPDLIGVLRIWTGPDSSTELAYFTSEADAREGEKRQPPPELAQDMGQFEEMMQNVEFLDLKAPWLY